MEEKVSKEKIVELMEKIEENSDIKYEVMKNIINSSLSSIIMPYLANYINDYCITVSGIAEIAKKSSQAVISMIKCNEGDFPCAYNINGTNYYIKNDVIEWLINNNKIPRDKNDEIKTEFLYGKQKSVYFTGGPGNGKSTICASGADPSIVPYLKKILTAGGSADTENLIKLHFKKNSANYVVFHYGNCSNDSIPMKIDENNVDRIKKELENCKEFAKTCRQEGEKDQLIGTYVEFVLEPNKMVSKLMNECNIDILTFIDTPGLDSSHSGDSVAMADIIVMVLGDRDEVESITKKIKENIVPQTGTAQYIYLYNNRFAFDYKDSDKVYDEFLAEAKKDLVDYVKPLKNLQDELIIGSTLSACKPIDSLICVPNFSRNVGIIEEFFFNKFCEKMKEALSTSSYVMELNSFNMNELPKEFLELLNKHIKMFADDLPKDDTSYDIESFKKENHGRTKSLDNYRIEDAFTGTMRSLKNYFYETFSQYKTADYDEYNASIIRMVYLTINEGLMNKVRYGYGSHPWEDINSPTQMICEEVLSKELISDAKNRTYCQILRDNSISSNSWNYVYVYHTDWNKAKLEIASNYQFTDFKTSDLKSYIKVCHFLPSILVQSVLAYYKMNPSLWNKANKDSYDKVIKSVMNGVKLNICV